MTKLFDRRQILHCVGVLASAILSGCLSVSGLVADGALATVPDRPLTADTYRVRVTRIDTNLYRELTSKLIIETRLCLELAIQDDAVLRWDGKYGTNWIIFSNNQKCDVIDLR